MIHRIDALTFACLMALLGCGGGTESAASPPVVEVPVLNASFDQVSATGALVSWLATEHSNGQSYTFQADSKSAWSASACLLYTSNRHVVDLRQQLTRCRDRPKGNCAALKTIVLKADPATRFF